MASKKKQRWGVGDLFLIPLVDGSACLAQVIGQESSVLNSCSLAIFDRKITTSNLDLAVELDPKDIFSILFVTRDLLDAGQWAVIGSNAVVIPTAMLPFESLRHKGFIGAKIEGSKLVEDFVNAFYGLAPWDDWFDPNYLDELLLTPDKKPVGRLVMKASNSP